MPYTFGVTQAMVENRLSSQVVKRIYDDNRDGVADANPVQQLIADGVSRIAGALRPTYDLAAVEASTPHEVQRLVLDAIEIYAAKRFPTYVRRDWEKLEKFLRDELKDLREGRVRLDVIGAPEPAKNTGGKVRAPSGSGSTDPPSHFILDDSGDF